MKEQSDRPCGLALGEQKHPDVIAARLGLTKGIYSIRAAELKQLTLEDLHFWSGPLAESARKKSLAKKSQIKYDAAKKIEKAVEAFEETCKKHGRGPR